MKSRTLLATLGLAFSVGLAPSKTLAASTFTFDSSINQLSSFNLTQDGITLTVSNFISDIGVSKSDSDGICIADKGGGYCKSISSLSLTFNKSVRLLSYITGYNDFNNVSVSFTQLSSTSTQNSFVPGDVTPFNNQFTAAPGIPIITARTSTTTDVSSLQLKQLIVEQAPISTVPGPVPLAGAAIALSWSRKLRRRNSSR